MACSESDVFEQHLLPKLNFEYSDWPFLLFTAILVPALCYIFYRQFSFRNFPSISLEFFIIYVRLFIKEISMSTVLCHHLISAFKKFENEGLLLAWLVTPHLTIFHERYVKILLNDEECVDKPSFPYGIVSDMIGKSILTLNGTEWKECKKTLSPLFRFHKLRNTVMALNEQAEDIVKNIAKGGNNSIIDVLPILKMGIVKAFCETILDTKMDDDRTELYQYIKCTSSLGCDSVQRMFQPWLWWKNSLFLFSEGRKLLKNYEKNRECSKKVVKKIMSNSSIGYTENNNSQKVKKKLIYSIFSEKFAKDPSFTMRDAEDAVSVLLFGGHDTTSYGLMWCLFMLGLHQDIQEKALEEIELVTKQSTGYISYENLKDLKYLECIIKETLRLYPVVPVFVRKTRKQLKFGKYTVPKNTTVYVITYMLHRNSESFPDPDAFDPERFNGECLEQPWTYVPFSEGIRNCIGKAFGIMEMKIILAHILRNFKVTSLDKREDVMIDIKIVLAPVKPIRLQFTDRRSCSQCH